MKKGHTFRVWKRRFFLFETDRLEYRKAPNAEVLGVIPLRRFDVTTPSPDSKDFEIQTPGRTYYLRAETLQSKINWHAELLALQKRLKDAPRSHGGPASGALPPGALPSGKAANEKEKWWATEQSSVHCGTCKATFGLSRKKHWCTDCGFAYCSSPKCFSLLTKVCTVCSHDTTAAGSAAAEGQLVDASSANLVVRVIEARDLRAADRNGLSDPYAVVYLSGRKTRTKTVYQSLFPWWDEQFDFSLEGVSNRAGIQVAIYDEDKYTQHDFLGMVFIPLASLRGDTRLDAWFPLQPRPGDRDRKTPPTGAVHLSVCCSACISLLAFSLTL